MRLRRPPSQRPALRTTREDMHGYPWQRSREVILNLPKCRVQVLYQAYQSVGYGGYGCLYPYPYPIPCISIKLYPVPGYFAAAVPNLPKCWGTGMDVVPNLPKCRVRVWISYRTYQSIGYGYGCRTELTKVSGTGMDVVPNLPNERVWMSYQTY